MAREILKMAKEGLRSTSVKRKILGLAIGLVLLMGFTSLILARQLLTINLTEDLERRAVAISNDFAVRSTDLAISNNIYSLYEIIQETLKNNPDIEYIFLLDSELDVIIHTFGKGFKISNDLKYANLIETDKYPYQLKQISSETGRIHDVNVPLIEGKAGYVRIGLNEKLIQKSINNLTILMIVSILAIGMIAVFISSFFTRIIYRDLHELMVLTNEVGSGNLDCMATIHSKDEIGQLGIGFNTMIQRVKSKKEALLLRNNELMLINNLLTTSHDINHLKIHLDKTTQKLKEVLKLNSCSISFKIGLEMISNFNGKKVCESCNFYQLKSPTKDSHYYFPIKMKEEELGGIQVCFNEEPDETTITFLDSFAKQLSVIVENAKLWNEVKSKERISLQLLNRVITAQEEERKRIARELHDETSQSLTSMLVRLALIEGEIRSTDLKEQIKELKLVAQQTLEEIHYISWSLRPSVLDDLGLVPAIKKYVYEFMNKYMVDVDVQVIGFQNIRLSSILEVTIYRVIQEALTNIARHSHAENVSIILRNDHQALSIIIEDDGIGFDVNRSFNTTNESKDHLGLKGMEERIHSIGGDLIIESNHTIGTTIYVKNIQLGGWANETEDHASG